MITLPHTRHVIMAGSADLANGVAQCDSLEHSDRLWNFVQASTLIALYLYQNGRFIEAYHQTCQVCPHFLVLPKKKKKKNISLLLPMLPVCAATDSAIVIPARNRSIGLLDSPTVPTPARPRDWLRQP